MSGLNYLLLLSLLLLMGWLIQREIRARQSQDWPTTTGKVISSQLLRYSGPGNLFRPFFRPRIEYKYMVKGTTYTSFTITWAGLPERPRDLVTHFPEGEKVTVYYHPTTPHLSVLTPGGSAIRTFLTQAVLPVLGLLVAITLILIIFIRVM